ncbi:hypothetical protein QEN19_003211 [Hanseniaspora menglaensis]
MDSLEMLTSDEDQINSQLSTVLRENTKEISAYDLNQQEPHFPNNGLQATPTFVFPPNKTNKNLDINEKSYEALRLIPSPTSTYLELEEEHRKKTEEILGQNASSPLIINKLNLVPDANESDKNIVSSAANESGNQDDGFIIEHNDSEQILASHEFKTGRHSRQYSDNRFLSLRTIRNTIHGSTSSISQNIKGLTKEPLISSPYHGSSKRASRLQRLKSNSISNNVSLSHIKKEHDNITEQTFNTSNISSKKNSLQFHMSNYNESKTDMSLVPNPNIELQMTKDQFKIQTLLSQMKTLEIENEKLKGKLNGVGDFELESSNDSENNVMVTDKVKFLEDSLYDAKQEIINLKLKNEQLFNVYEEEEEIINQLEDELSVYDSYTKELIFFIKEKVQNNKKNDQFSTLNNKYQIKNYEEGDMDSNFQNIYKFMNQVFEILVDSNMEKQFLREEMLHDAVASDSAESLKAEICKDLLENNNEVNQKLKKIEHLIVNLIEKEHLKNESISEALNNYKNNEKNSSHKPYCTCLEDIDKKLSSIYNFMHESKVVVPKKVVETENDITKQNVELNEKINALENTYAHNVNIIEEQEFLIQQLYDNRDKVNSDRVKFYKVLLMFLNTFILKLLNKIETGDKESLLRPIKKLNKIEFLLTTSLEDSFDIILGHFKAILYFIEQSVELLIDKFNEEIIDRNKALKFAVEKNLFKKWEGQSESNNRRKLNMKK